MLVKDQFRCERKDKIQVKGFDNPVQTFSVKRKLEDLSAITFDVPGLAIQVKPEQLEDKEEALQIFEDLKKFLAS